MWWLVTARTLGAVAYSPDGRRIATGSSDGFVGKVTIWDARNATEVSSYTLPGNLTSICFSGAPPLPLWLS
ncbi:hypothetical protein T484DRAFT_1789187 [Baffinella frigidus]|nr:hypothetical protein T484DRAFT_1789187 [Cryptophyta sp. CCMP2293]